MGLPSMSLDTDKAWLGHSTAVAGSSIWSQGEVAEVPYVKLSLVSAAASGPGCSFRLPARLRLPAPAMASRTEAPQVLLL